MFYRTLAENSALKIWYKMWFLGPYGTGRRQGRENSFSHCFSFTSDHCSSSALDPSAPVVGEAERFKWSKIDKADPSSKCYLHHSCIKFFQTLWALSPYIFHKHWGLAECGGRWRAIFRFWATGLFLHVHLRIFTSFLNIHICVYPTFHVFLSRFFIGMCSNVLLAIIFYTTEVFVYLVPE